jgi:la-related protein 1
VQQQQQQTGFYQPGAFQRPPPPPPATHFMMPPPYGSYVPPFGYPGEPNHPVIIWNEILISLF